MINQPTTTKFIILMTMKNDLITTYARFFNNHKPEALAVLITLPSGL